MSPSPRALFHVLCLCLAWATATAVEIVLDDMNESAVEAMNEFTTFEGSYTPCMQDAYLGQFHHDWARNKGNAYLKYSFEIPQDGCYKLEEHHPGGTWECARYLPENTKLKVEYCRGQSIDLRYNQAERGAQWNELGYFPFFKGYQGRLTASNSDDEQCADNCFWVVDAFRLTWTGPACAPQLTGEGVYVDDATAAAATTTQPTTMQPAPEDGSNSQGRIHPDDMAAAAPSAMTQAPSSTTGEAVKAALATRKGHFGSLRLGLRAEGAEADLYVELEAHRNTLRVALSSFFSDDTIQVLHILAETSSGRRLASNAVFDVGIKAAAQHDVSAAGNLHEHFQEHFSRAGAGFTVEHASLAWKEDAATPSDGGLPKAVIYVGLSTIGVIFLVALIAPHLVASWRHRREGKAVEENAEFGADAAPELEAGEWATGKLDKEDEEMRDDTSTLTPGSDNHTEVSSADGKDVEDAPTAMYNASI